MKTVKIKIADMQMQCPCQSENVTKAVILKGRIFPTILTNNDSSLAEFPYISNFINGWNTRGTKARLSSCYNWGEVTVLPEASRTYAEQFRGLTCFLWDSDISKGTALRSTKASHILNSVNGYLSAPQKASLCYCRDSRASFHPEEASMNQQQKQST